MSYFNKKDSDGNIIPKSRPDIPNVNSGSGSRYALCSGCRELFSTPGNFDAHRKTAGYADNYYRVCKDPESVGLVLGERGAWVAQQEWYTDSD